MSSHEGVIRIFLIVLVALSANLVLDIAFELPMLARWGIALAVVLLLTFVVEVIHRRVGGRARDESRYRA